MFETVAFLDFLPELFEEDSGAAAAAAAEVSMRLLLRAWEDRATWASRSRPLKELTFWLEIRALDRRLGGSLLAAADEDEDEDDDILLWSSLN